MKTITQKVRKVHRNLPQLLVFLIDAVITVALFGRGTGKTFGVTSTWVYNRARKLAGSTGFICSPSYTHLIDTIIPEMENGWRDLGLVEGKHYWKYEKPPAELGIPMPYTSIDNAKYYIFWLNGSATKLVSLDKKALVNSKSFDYGAICEARKCKESVVKEDLIPTLRGSRNKIAEMDHLTGKVISRFKDHHIHHSLLLESDLPRHPTERWILKYRKRMDVNIVNDILKLQSIKAIYKKSLDKAKEKYFAIRDHLAKSSGEQSKEALKKSESRYRAKIKREQANIDKVESGMNEMRQDLIFVANASTLDNIHVLGISTLKKMRESLSPTDWDVSVLGNEQEEVEFCFYSALSKEIHGYHATNFKYIEKTKAGQSRNWRRDTDYKQDQPIYISLDANAAHNCFNIFQMDEKKGTLNKINYFWQESTPSHPTDLTTLTQEFKEYYAGVRNKKIYLVYNHTLTAGRAAGQKAKVDEVINELKIDRLFTVIEEPVGQAWSHENLHEYWGKLLKGKTKWKFGFNLANCDLWYDCCKDTPVLITDGRNGTQIKKDKRSEKPNSKIPPHQATHATEGADTMIQFISKKESGMSGSGQIAIG